MDSYTVERPYVGKFTLLTSTTVLTKPREGEPRFVKVSPQWLMIEGDNIEQIMKRVVMHYLDYVIGAMEREKGNIDYERIVHEKYEEMFPKLAKP